jgi:cysteine desulfurase/selenocysteine lyase
MTMNSIDKQDLSSSAPELERKETSPPSDPLSVEALDKIAQQLFAEIPGVHTGPESNLTGLTGVQQMFAPPTEGAPPMDIPHATKSQPLESKPSQDSHGMPTAANDMTGGALDFRSLLADVEQEQIVSLPKRVSYQRLYFMPAGVPPVVSSSDQHMFSVRAVREDFPILQQTIHGKPLIWFDNAATSQKPLEVIQALQHYYEMDNSNVHRGVHELAGRATDAYENARAKVREFLGARSTKEIIFTHGATESINLVAQTFGRSFLDRKDEVLLTTLEHHSNIVPWQLLREERGIVLRIIPVDNQGDVILDEYEKLLGPRTKLVALTHVSNAIGTVLPLQQMIAMAHRHGAKVLVDGAQSVPHFRVNVQSLDTDFFAFAGHKMFGPTGIGVLFGKSELLEQLPPWQGGGSMIERVTFDETIYKELPYKFEAGTPIIAGAVGLGAAIDYLNRIGFESAALYEHELVSYALQRLMALPRVRIIGMPTYRAGVISFLIDGIAPEAVGRFLNEQGIAVRAGHHCAQPALARFGVAETVRASLALYNTYDEVDTFVGAVDEACKVLAKQI